MIFAHDKGRLCNNILQFAHVYAWGREHGKRVMSMRFAYKYRYFKICHTARHNFFNYLIAKYGSRWGFLPVVHFDYPEADYSHEERVMLQRHNVVVEGWYARWYDLFLKYKSEIIEMFAFDKQVMLYPQRFLDSLQKSDILLGMHIRRGDYKDFYGGLYYFSDEQYISQIRQFLRIHSEKRVQVLVCGNERSLNQQAYRQAFPNVSIEFPCGNPGEDLYLLSQCDYLIGPPSTFSLVASMYRNVPLYWIEDANRELCMESFDTFDHLFRNIK